MCDVFNCVRQQPAPPPGQDLMHKSAMEDCRAPQGRVCIASGTSADWWDVVSKQCTPMTIDQVFATTRFKYNVHGNYIFWHIRCIQDPGACGI